jgi:predicted DCC family thiol-disulfide oxidoreductase YuxK
MVNKKALIPLNDQSFFFMSSIQNGIYPVVLFDGVCNLCNGFVNLLIRIDKKAAIRFLPLQSPGISNFKHPDERIQKLSLDLTTVILIEGEMISQKSDAILRIATYLPWPWKALKFFSFLPVKFRDAIYDWIARNRYKWFGKKDSCMVPTPDLMKRFL